MPLTANEVTAAKFHYECILSVETEEERAPHWQALGTMIREDTIQPLRELGLLTAIEMMNQAREKMGLPRKKYTILEGGKKGCVSY